jgi:small subunit ribosomal protein S5e
MVALGLPASVSATADGSRKLFNKWSYEEVEVKDISLQDYIQIRQHVYLPHTAGRFAVKRFRKAQVSLKEKKGRKMELILLHSAPSLSV